MFVRPILSALAFGLLICMFIAIYVQIRMRTASTMIPVEQTLSVGSVNMVKAENSNEAPKSILSRSVSPFSNSLGASDQTQEDDLRTIHSMLLYYTLEDGRQMPVGTNQEITKALITPNQYGQSYLSRKHPSIDFEGKLVDRWGTAYFLHALSSQEMEVRSAGADLRMYTDDDLIWPQAEISRHPNAHEFEVDIR